MTPPPINIDGSDITGATIDGTDVQEVTVDGTQVFSAIPDSEDLQARYTTESLSLTDGDAVSGWDDQTDNNNDLSQPTTSNQPTYKTGVINGNPVVRFNGTDEFLDVSFSTLSQPFSIFYVGALRSSSYSSQRTFIDSESSNFTQFYVEPGGNYEIFAGKRLESSTGATNNNIINGAVFDGTNSAIRVSGSETTGNPGTNGLNGITLGSRFDQNNYADIDLLEVLVYDGDKSAVASDIENHLSAESGVSV